METITLGGAEITVTPQRHAYLSRRVGPAITAVLARGEGITADTLVEFAGEGVYDLLTALIPSMEKRMPRWQFMGYGSQAALDGDEYDEAGDESPTILEIKEAFVVGLRVNGIDELVKLGKVLDPALLRATVNRAVATTIENSINSPSSPFTNGTPPSTSSGTTDPTPVNENSGSPLAASAP